MNIKDLKTVASLVGRFGVKIIIHGGPGSGKTPLMLTAPTPVIGLAEPGALSIRTSQAPAVECYTFERFKEFVTWFCESKEAHQFETCCIDSLSQVAENLLEAELKVNKDPRKAYGELSRKMMEMCSKIYFAQRGHFNMITKRIAIEQGTGIQWRPYFPGQDLNVKIPHLFDLTLHAETLVHQNVTYKVLRTRENASAFARERMGVLEELEPSDLSHIIKKVMTAK